MLVQGPLYYHDVILISTRMRGRGIIHTFLNFHPTLIYRCDYISMLGFKWIHVSKRPNDVYMRHIHWPWIKQWHTFGIPSINLSIFRWRQKWVKVLSFKILLPIWWGYLWGTQTGHRLNPTICGHNMVHFRHFISKTLCTRLAVLCIVNNHNLKW